MNHTEINDGFKKYKIHHNAGKNASGIIFLYKQIGHFPCLLYVTFNRTTDKLPLQNHS